LVVITCREGAVLLASRGERPAMPLNILQCTGQPLQQRFIWAQMSVSGAEIEKSSPDSGGNSGTKNEARNYEGRLDGPGLPGDIYMREE